MKKEEKEYIETLAFNMGLALTTVSKGRAWINISKDSVQMTGLTPEDAKQAGIIQMMFNEAVKKKHMDIEKVQKALDYFGWDLYLVKDGESVTFRGQDKFLLVQIAHYMGAMDSETYAKMYRDAIKENQKVFL